MYPLKIFSSIAANILAVLIYLSLLNVIPQFEATFSNFGSDIPLFTSFALKSYRFFWIIGVLIAIAALVAGIKHSAESNKSLAISLVNFLVSIAAIFGFLVAMYLPIFAIGDVT